MAFLEARAIRKSYPVGDTRLTVLRDLDLLVEAGEMVAIVGASSGYALSYVLDRYKVIRVPTDVYQVSHMPFTVLPLDFALVIVAAVLVCFVATIYPSRQASRLDPAQALRYE